MIDCQELNHILASQRDCKQTDWGTRIATDCLYPSFERVHVFITRFGEGFKVTDGGGAMRSAWQHGREGSSTRRILHNEAHRADLKLVDDTLVGDAPDQSWLWSVILTVANASSQAARAVSDKQAALSESRLREEIGNILYGSFTPAEIHLEPTFVGRSGAKRTFDFSVTANDNTLLISAIAPHHSSIFAKYVSFADTGPETPTPLLHKLGVIERGLDQQDTSLMLQVSELVTLDSLTRVAQGAALARHAGT